MFIYKTSTVIFSGHLTLLVYPQRGRYTNCHHMDTGQFPSQSRTVGIRTCYTEMWRRKNSALKLVNISHFRYPAIIRCRGSPFTHQSKCSLTGVY